MGRVGHWGSWLWWGATAVAMLGCGGRHLGGRDAATPDGAPNAADTATPDGGVTLFPSTTASGTRLRARTWVAADGTRRLDTIDGTARGQIWFDTKLQTPCTFQGADDALTCVPLTAFGDPPNIFGNVAAGFLDGACRGERLAAGPFGSNGPAAHALRGASCGAKRYAALVHEDTSGEPDVLDLFEVGAPLSAQPVFGRPLNQPDGCAPTPADAPNHFFRLGRKVARDELIRAHVETIPTGRRMSFVSIVADDGARQRVGWFDTTLGVGCAIGAAPDGQPRCLPNATGLNLIPGFFGDAGCSARLAFSSSVAPGTFALATDDQGGATQGAYYRFGASPKQVFVLSGTTCTPITDDPKYFSLISDELPPSTFDAFPTTTVVNARLETIVHADREGAIEPFPLTPEPFPSTIVDKTTHQPCDFAPTPDGKARCLPEWNVVRYMSPTCAAAPGAAVVTLYSLADRRPSHAAAWSGDVCTGGFALFQLGPRLGPQTSDLWDTTGYGDFCVANPVHDESTDVYAVGAAEPAAAFEEAALITE